MDLCWQSNVSAFKYAVWVSHSFSSKEQASVNFVATVTIWSDFGAPQNKVFIFLGSKIKADDDCSHEIKRCLLLGRKAMTNLDNILKSRDISLPTNLHIVKAEIFPVVMYGCESWTIKKAEH